MNREEKQSKRQRFIIPDERCPPADYSISSLVAERRGGHDHVKVWSRGGLAGELVLEAGVVNSIAAVHGLARDEGEAEQ